MLIFSIVLSFLFIPIIHSYQSPFSTLGNTVIDANGIVVKLKCVNWPASMETLMPEGLQHRPIDSIVLLIRQMNFTCVRLVYSIDQARSSDLTARQSLTALNLASAVSGFAQNNPTLIDAPVSTVFDAVLDALERSNIWILLDNHVSKAMWCCSDNDGNGFWGDRYFDVEQWLAGLRFMAEKSLNRPHVIAMSLRNELRGLRQTQFEFYQYVLRGILESVSKVNPQLLILVSGLNYDLDLSFIRLRPIQGLVPNTSRNKIVYEGHWYSWSGYGQSSDCDKMKQGIHQAWGYLLEENHPYTAPVWLTEFGTNVDQFTGNDQFINCVGDYLGSPLTSNMSWAYWVLAGTYYVRSGAAESHETFGLLTDNWASIKSQTFINVLLRM